MPVVSMNREDIEVIFNSDIVPGESDVDQLERLLRHFGTDDGRALGLRLLSEAVASQDSEAVEAALDVCFIFGFGDEHLDLLRQLAWSDWHNRHEDVASMLDDLRSSEALDALVHLASWVPKYLDYDDARALAVKALWGLGNMPGNGQPSRWSGCVNLTK
jgi:hypothetical protein